MENSNSFAPARDKSITTMKRSLVRNVYLWMTIGLIKTGVTAYSVKVNTQLLFVSAIGTIGIVLFLSFSLEKISTTTATILFGAFSVLEGMSPIYSYSSIYTYTNCQCIFYYSWNICCYVNLGLYN